MRFGPLAPRDAMGGVLAHGVMAGAVSLRKGLVIGADHVAALEAAGVDTVIVAIAGPNDLGEDEAAARIARAAAGPDSVRCGAPATGRVNLFAAQDGLLVVDRARIDRLNSLDEALTLATLPSFKPVVAGEMIGTVKIIPFFVDNGLVETGETVLAGLERAVMVRPFARLRIGAISTLLPGIKASLVDKTIATFGRRLAALGGNAVMSDRRVAHATDALAAALREEAPAHELIVVFGATAISDRRDVIPAAIEAAGGTVIHLGMPVDPGNLLLIGQIGACRVIGAPGCARSPAENGFDWVLQRLIAGVATGRAEIRAMGVGGLLMEIVSRPQPRDDVGAAAGAVAAVVLAAGRSTRMGRNKLAELIAGEPVVRHVVKVALDARLRPVRVVTGHDPATIHAALDGLDVAFVHNADFESGMAGSLRAGLAALPDGVQAAIVLLGDMPLISEGTLAALIEAHRQRPEALAIVPTVDGQRANPVLIGRGLFAAVQGLSGDIGARKLIETLADGVIEVEVGDAGALIDVDTPESLEAVRRIRT